MSMVLAVTAFLFLGAGLLGSIVPVIPGPPLGYIGLLLLQRSGYGNFSASFLLFWAGIIVAVTVMDYILPALMTKRFGGSRAAMIGSVLGLLIGMIFFAPIGLLVGSFLGALAGELINNHIQARRAKVNNNQNSSGTVRALKAAMGAFLAFIAGTGVKLISAALMIYYAVRVVL